MQRELGMNGLRGNGNPYMTKTRINSSLTNRHISQRFIPDNCTKISKHPHSIFCGLYSEDGEMYMSACKGMFVFVTTMNFLRRQNSLVQHQQLEEGQNNCRQ